MVNKIKIIRKGISAFWIGVLNAISRSSKVKIKSILLRREKKYFYLTEFNNKK